MISQKTLKGKRHFLIFAFASCLVAFSANISAPITDTFHEGELVGFLWQMLDYYKRLARFPLFVHGGMDYIPSLIALSLFGETSIIIGTRFVITFISAIYYFIFFDVCYSLLKAEQRNGFWILILLVLFFYFAPPLGSHILEVGSFPLREIFLLLTIWFFLKDSTSESLVTSNLSLALGSCSAIISVFWCYNRGLITIVFFTIIFSCLVIRKETRKLLIIVCSAFFCLFFLERSIFFGTIAENFKNIMYWIENAAGISNRYPFDIAHMPGYLGLLILFISTIFIIYLVFIIRNEFFRENIQVSVILLGLISIQLLLIKSVFDRADIERSFLGGWPSIFIMLFIMSRLYNINIDIEFINIKKTNYYEKSSSAFKTKLTNFAVLFLIIFMIFSSPKVLLTYPVSIKNIITKKTDRQLVSKDIVALADFIERQNINCYYNWTNEGVIALIAKKAYCTDYPYVHYASKNHEQNMLRQLDYSSPNAIVYDSQFWSVAINQKHMSDRFPLIDQYIKDNYDKKIDIGTYQVVFKSH